jgi:signal transduction histidine kinase/phage shock protein PspC (stress-responsive transcriptional regulator)
MMGRMGDQAETAARSGATAAQGGEFGVSAGMPDASGSWRGSPSSPPQNGQDVWDGPKPHPSRPQAGEPQPGQPQPGQPLPGQPHQASSGHWTARLESYGLRVTRGPGSAGPLRRARGDQLFGGVAAGLAKRTGFSVGLIRVAFIIATVVTTGYLAMAYVLAWLLIPAEDAESNIGTKALADKRGIGLAAGLASVLVLALIIASALNAPWVTSLAVPLIASAAGLVLIWRNAPEDELEYLRGLADPAGMTETAPRSRRVLRVIVAAVVLVIGLTLLLQGHDRFALLKPLAGVILLVGGIALAFGPWWLRIAMEAAAERRARIRAEERAEMASRVHDSVLQTLALIQRRAGDQHQVIQLARAQERELRAWLFDGRPPGSMEGQAATVADGVRVIQQDVESQHGVAVEAVTVGDCELDDDLSALLAAAREATVNAAKWSGADVVSLFAEVEPDSVSLFVRDRGRGFDPAAVPSDRKGLAESVRARMARRGGSATVRSTPGQGTEVSLVMPRPAVDRLPRRP